MRELREILFNDADGALANAIVPDGRVNIPDEVRRYKSLTIGGRVGWEPPYFHNRKLAKRLRRVSCPTLLVWGENDRFVPPANGRAYAAALPNATMKTIPGCGHSVVIEKPEECLALLGPFLAGGAA
jgi:pimeloyl-ACP methyl ester carboxylesterase